MVGQSARFTRQDSVQETWRILQPLLDAPPPVHPYAKGSWGPDAAAAWWRGTAAGAVRGWSHEPGQGGQARTAGRRHRRRRGVQSSAMPSPFPPIDDYDLPLQLPHRRAGRPRRGHRLAVRAPVRLAERVRGAARPGGWRLPAGAVRHQRPVGAGLRARDQHPGHDLEDAGGLGRGPRRAHHGPAAGRGRGHPAHPAPGRRRRRPPAGPDGPLPGGRGRVELVCEPIFDYGRTLADWALVDEGRQVADASGAGQTVRLRTSMELGIEANRVRGPARPARGRAALVRVSWAEGLAVPEDLDDANRAWPRPRFWRSWL